MHVRENYKIIAFCCLVKYHRADSCIPMHRKAEFSKEIGMHYNTFMKYLSICREKKFIKDLINNYQVISLVDILNELNIGLDKRCRWTDWAAYETISFKTIYEKIVGCLLLKNYRQQQYRIDKKEAKLDLLFSSGNLEVKNKFTKKVAREAAKAGMSYKDYIKRMREKLNRDIVTGKNHVAGIIGCSATSGDRWLKKLVKSGDISREIVRTYADLPLCPASLEVLEEERRVSGGRYAIVQTPKGFLFSKGSRIHLTSK